MGELLGAAVEATGSGARLRWDPRRRAALAGAEPWTELPLWAPEDEMAGTWLSAPSARGRPGLRCRRRAETVADVAAWLRDGGEAGAERLGLARAPGADERRARGGTPRSGRVT
jgi:hypothetical protein